LAFGPHPDDVELGMGGTLARQSGLGHATAIIDLTRGEMGSNGTPAERLAEGEAAAHILGCRWRRNLALPDRGLDYRDPGQMRTVVEAIRQVRPAVAFVNWGADRHPDHRAAHQLMQEALFNAGLRRYETGQEPYRPAKVLYYFINDEQEPSFYVDITPVYPQKIESLFAHVSQFRPAEGAVATRLNGPAGLPYLIESRDRLFGARAGVSFAEGFLTTQARLVSDLMSL
jgi:bacillithiol biosynthesis deacetylase BshB1